jgi:hypothetical protein
VAVVSSAEASKRLTKPSDGLEPSTPSLPSSNEAVLLMLSLRIKRAGHARALAVAAAVGGSGWNV